MPDMQKVLQTKERILEVIKQNGPEFPVRVASATGGNNLFTAAFMSELVSEQKLKISNMRVGGSPLYYILGQEEQLQRYTNYLNHKEREAFKLLKEKEILVDSEQEPAIRVALRSIKDFAIQIKTIEKGEEKIFWKLHTISNEKTKEIIDQIINPPQKKQQEVQKVEEQKQEIEEVVQKIEEEKPIILAKEILVKKKEYAGKVKDVNSPFLDNIKKILIEKEYELTKEILVKKKEYAGKVKINTLLGKQEFYLVAKDKKKITLDDLVSTLQKAQSEKMPALIISPGEIDKKAQEYFKEWNNLIKHQKIAF